MLKVGAANVNAFLGAPGAAGLSLSEATLGLVVFPEGTFAAEAGGSVEFVGADVLSLAGDVELRVNTSTRDDFSEDIPVGTGSTTIAFAPGESGLQHFVGEGITLSTPIGGFTSDIFFTTDGTTNEVLAGGTGIDFFIGKEDQTLGLQVTGAEFALLLLPDRTYAFQAGGEAAFVGVSGLTLRDDFGVEINTLVPAADVAREITVGGVTKALDVAVSTSRFGGEDVELTVAGQTLRGNFTVERTTDTVTGAGLAGVVSGSASASVGPVEVSFETTTTASGEFAVLVGGENVSLALGDGSGALVRLADGQGGLLLTGAGLAGQVHASVEVNLPGIDFGGDFALAINTTGAPVVETVTVGTSPIELELPAGPYLRVDGQGKLVSRGGELYGRFSGSVVVDVPAVTVSGSFSVAINTASEARMIDGVSIDPGIQVIAQDAVLDIAGQEISGQFAIEQTKTPGPDGDLATTADNGQVVKIAVTELGIKLGDPAESA